MDQKNGPSGWRFKDGSRNKLRPGSNIQLPPEATKKRKATSDENSDEKVKSARTEKDKKGKDKIKGKEKTKSPEVISSSK